MTREVDGYLSRRAQQVEPRSLVVCIDRGTAAEAWQIETPDAEPLGLGDSFGRAQQSVVAFVRSRRAQ